MKLTVEISSAQKQIIDKLKGDLNNELFAKLLEYYTKPRVLTVPQSEYLATLEGGVDRHTRLAVDDYIHRLRLHAKHVDITGKPSKSDNALSKAHQLVEYIMQANRDATNAKEMVYINLSVLKKRCNGSINQRILQRVLYLMQDLLNEHHQKLGISSNHNRCRRIDAQVDD